MKVRFEPNEFEIGKEYRGKMVEVSESTKHLLLQAHKEPEVFVVLDNVKHWLQNPETAKALNYNVSKRQGVTLVEINWYKTGDTFNMFGEPKKARDIYFPSEEPEEPEVPVCKAWRSGDMGIIGTGTGEGSMPSTNDAKELCDLWLPFKTYTGFMERIGKVGVQAIFMHTVRNESQFNVAGYLAIEEPLSKPSGKPIGNPDDGKVTDSNTIWGRINTFRRKTNKPVGILDNDVHFRVGSKEYLRHIDLSLACDFLLSEVYPYHVNVSDPIQRMKDSYKWIAEFSEKHNKPFGVVAQATYGEANGKLNFPDLEAQYNYWVRDKGLSIFWWKWSGGSGKAIKEEFMDEIKRLHKLG